jgi:hypothetical protein
LDTALLPLLIFSKNCLASSTTFEPFTLAHLASRALANAFSRASLTGFFLGLAASSAVEVASDLSSTGLATSPRFPVHEQHYGKMAELILKTESAGILNWLLEGRSKLSRDKLQLT